MREQTEAKIQADFFTWLSQYEKRFPELQLWYSVPNGSHKSPAARSLHKRTGLKSGVPDTHLPVAKGIHAGLWIEFKSKVGKVSPTQKEWAEKLLVQGHEVKVCRTWTDAANATIDYLNLPLKKFPTEKQKDKPLQSGGERRKSCS